MQIDHEQLIEEMTKAVKSGSDISVWKKNRATAPLLTLISKLFSMPKSRVPNFDYNRVRNQILDRISIPKMQEENSWLSLTPRFLKIGFTLVGSLMILVSLTWGTAVTALQSVPGDALYPFKKVVENVQLKLTPGNDKLALEIKFADNRMEELQSVLDQQEQGKISEQEAQKIVTATVTDLNKTTASVAKSIVSQPKAVSKLTDISNKIKIASVKSEGSVKIELQKALDATQSSEQEAIKNIERAGIKVEDKPITLDNSITASGKLTAMTDTSVSIGTAKFLLKADTKYSNVDIKTLKVGQVVDIAGEITDNKTYADKITMVSDVVPTQVPDETTTTKPTSETQQIPTTEKTEVPPDKQ